MRILVLADLHANWPALAAIDEPFDVCLILGDLVEYGTDAAECIDWVRENSHLAIRGNHDHSTVQRMPPTPTGSLQRQLAAATRQLHERTLTPHHFKFLSRLPVTQTLQLDGMSFYLVHATPRDPMDEYLGPDPDGWAQRLKEIEADFVLVGHTHIPMHLKLDRWEVLNPGSVGQPRDGDPRAAYAVIEDGRVTLKRKAYDVEATISRLRSAGLTGEALQYAQTLLRTGGRPVLAASVR
jgi:putative phosphoesterase